MRTYEREMSAQERRLIEADLADAERPVSFVVPVVWASVGAIAIGAIVVVIVRTAAAPGFRPADWLPVLTLMVPLLLVAGGITFGAMRAIAERRRWGRNLREQSVPLMRALLAEGRVRAHAFASTKGVRFAEFEDEGDVYLFELTGGRTLLLEGQGIPFPDGDLDWPGAAFELVEASVGDWFVVLAGDGTPLELKERPRSDAACEPLLGSEFVCAAPFMVRLIDQPFEDCLRQLTAEPTGW